MTGLTLRQAQVEIRGALESAPKEFQSGTKEAEAKGPQVMRVWTNSVDTVIAADMADAEAVWAEHMSDTYESACGAAFADEWSPVDPDKAITIRDDDGSDEQTKTAAEWAASDGRGFLCSTEY